ncbi:MAG TPA: amidophosphoribosyltransferase, partial [Flavobacteriales bacterium]|nr:amidophosphoribosyltransferase [Flavobacteriales bacterium]
IVVVSSAPQIRYPDCYGIDMAKMGDLAAFRAAIALLKETKQDNIIDDVYDRAQAMVGRPLIEQENVVKDIYRPFTAEQISDKMAEMLRPAGIHAEVKLVFQSIEGLHAACPEHQGDWYFTGNYPTPGGNRVVNRAFINYREGRNVRAY